LDPQKRMTSEEALRHPFIMQARSALWNVRRSKP